VVVRDCRGVRVVIPRALYDHVRDRHGDLMERLNVGDVDGFISVVRGVLLDPDEVYVDDRGSVYYLLRVGGFHLNVVVAGGVVRCVYWVRRVIRG